MNNSSTTIDLIGKLDSKQILEKLAELKAEEKALKVLLRAAYAKERTLRHEREVAR